MVWGKGKQTRKQEVNINSETLKNHTVLNNSNTNSLLISKKYIIHTEPIQNTESKTQDHDSLKKRLALHKIDRLLTVGFVVNCICFY